MTPGPPPAGLRGNVLVVDDDQVLCETVSEILVRRGFDVAWRISGRAALVLLETRPVEVLFTDLHMPEMDGLALCRQVSASYPEIIIIMASAFATESVKLSAREAGAFDFVTKPFDIDALRQAVERAAFSSRDAASRRGTPGTK